MTPNGQPASVLSCEMATVHASFAGILCILRECQGKTSSAMCWLDLYISCIPRLQLAAPYGVAFEGSCLESQAICASNRTAADGRSAFIAVHMIGSYTHLRRVDLGGGSAPYSTIGGGVAAVRARLGLEGPGLLRSTFFSYGTLTFFPFFTFSFSKTRWTFLRMSFVSLKTPLGMAAKPSKQCQSMRNG